MRWIIIEPTPHPGGSHKVQNPDTGQIGYINGTNHDSVLKIGMFSPVIFYMPFGPQHLLDADPTVLDNEGNLILKDAKFGARRRVDRCHCRSCNNPRAMPFHMINRRVSR